MEPRFPPDPSHIVHDPNISPRPNDIRTSDHFWSAFDHHETEVSARYIVMMMQERGGWHPFTREEINHFYQSRRVNYESDFGFNALIKPASRWHRMDRVSFGGGYIAECPDGLLRVTYDFVYRCHLSTLKQLPKATADVVPEVPKGALPELEPGGQQV